MVWLAENIQACLRDFQMGTASMARKRHLASTARGFCGFCLMTLVTTGLIRSIRLIRGRNKPISDAKHCNRSSKRLREKGLSRKTWGEGIPQKVSFTIFSPQTFTMADANVYDGGCKRLRERMQTFAVKRGSALQGRMQCTARTDAVHCGDGCSALRGRLQCTAGTVAVHCV